MSTATHAAPALAPTPGTPRWPRVAAEEIRAVGLMVQRELLVAGLLMAAVTVVALAVRLSGNGGTDLNLVDMAFPAILLGIFAPMAVWKDEAPARRAYFWSMPLDRGGYTLVRVFAGWSWLMLLVAAYLAWAAGTTLLTGGEFLVGGEWAQVEIRAELPPEQRIVPMSLAGNPWMWLVPFAGATALYVVGSIVIVLSDHPWRWYAGFAVVSFVLLELAMAARIRWLMEVLAAVVVGRFGLVTLLTGMPSAEAWAPTALLWTALALAGLLVAAHRHREP